MNLRYVTVDVFTDQAFGGNPLAVVFGAEALTAAQKQAVAREFNYSETTFVLPAEEPDVDAHVRIFTPAEELPFAGHPIVGTGFVLASERPEVAGLRISVAAGVVPITPLQVAGRLVGTAFQVPRPLSLGPIVAPAVVAGCVGLDAAGILGGAQAPQCAGTGLDFLIAQVADASLLDRVITDRTRLLAVQAEHAVGGLYLFALDVDGSVQARMFAPASGIEEDPATGSAAAALAALLSHRQGAAVRTTIAQGVAMGRPSRIAVEADRAGVRIGGNCVAMMQGELSFRS